MAILDHRGDAIKTEDILQTITDENPQGNLVLASDMDGTMFKNDLGILVFLEKLSDPRFWEFEEDRFSMLLLPKGYRRLLNDGKMGMYGDEMPSALCKLGFDLHQDIVRLYALIKKLTQEKRQSEDITLPVNEFARKMIEFDRIFMKLDNYMSRQMGGQLLMRTRFFAGKEPKDVQRLTEEVMRRTRTDMSRILTLGIHKENAKSARQTVTEETINEAHNEESPLKAIDRLVVPIDAVRQIIHRAITQIGAHAIVVTANLQGIASTAIDKSTYDFLKEQPGKKIVIGSRLRTDGKKLEARMEGKPVIGPQKAREILTYTESHGEELRIAIGDSPTTDGDMMRVCLEKGGRVFIVTRDPEHAIRRFENALGLREKSPETQERIYRVVPNGS